MESGESFRIAQEDRGENLDRDVAVQLRVARPVDVSHAAGPEQRYDLIGTDALAQEPTRRQRPCGGVEHRPLDE